MIQVQKFTFNAFQENCYVLYDHTREGIVIDPGCYTRQEQALLKSFIAQEGLAIKALLNTHCHVDHVLGNQFVKDTWQVPLYIHSIEESVLRSVESYAPAYGFPAYVPSSPDQFLSPDEAFIFGESSLQVLFVPGHSPGHVVFYSAQDAFCINGDVLFRGSIGRTDLPGGNFGTLMESIRQVMYKLPDATLVYCGHGPETTIGNEKRSNPFCRA